VSELAGLNKQQIQWQQGAIRIKGKGGPYGKKSKMRVVPMSRRLKPLLENFFVLNDKFPWTARTIQRVIKRIANKAAITKPLTPHVLRHSFAILWIHKNGSTRALQAILGHDHLSTTEIYLNISPEHVLQEFQSKW
jgi:integrase/recombinase XerD